MLKGAKKTSKWFRVAVSGDTVDGREITKKQIQEMADSYDPKRYAARVWTEHFRSLFPDGAFNAKGNVVGLKAEKITDVDVPALNGKLGLYAQVEAHQDLLDMQAKGQKLYHSIEMFLNFAKTNKAYFVGLATTDSPASQGTQVMAFGDTGEELVAGAPHQADLEFEPDKEPSLFARVKELLGQSKTDSDTRFTDINEAIEEIAKHGAGLESSIEAIDAVPKEKFNALKEQIETAVNEFNALKEQIETAVNEFNALKEQLSNTPGSASSRAPATGGDDTATDC